MDWWPISSQFPEKQELHDSQLTERWFLRHECPSWVCQLIWLALTFCSTGGTFTGLFKGQHVYRNACVASVISRNDIIVGGPVKEDHHPKIYLPLAPILDFPSRGVANWVAALTIFTIIGILCIVIWRAENKWSKNVGSWHMVHVTKERSRYPYRWTAKLLPIGFHVEKEVRWIM